MTTARRVGGTSCLAAGFLSAVLGFSLEMQIEPKPGSPPYPDDLSRAIGPLTDLLWRWATQVGMVALVLAVVLFAISYWLLRPPRRNA